SFEGDTGPYVLYTIVRIKSILAKYKELGNEISKDMVILPASGTNEQALMLELAKFNEMIYTAYEEIAPHRICQYIYDLANSFNSFYHDTKIISEEDDKKRSSWIALIILVQEVLTTCIDLLGIEAPERM
ncbi:MAG TPA: DALR anticodon-binding domain-containing protein, partial [Mobilitalea sp.]|nr:DALR anticodon-binding domain-containing protein [Mobilitalea sp.]